MGTVLFPVARPGSRLADALGKVERSVEEPQRYLRVNGKGVSVMLAELYWQALDEICVREAVSLNDLATRLANDAPSNTPLESTLSLFALSYFQDGGSPAGKTGRGM